MCLSEISLARASFLPRKDFPCGFTSITTHMELPFMYFRNESKYCNAGLNCLMNDCWKGRFREIMVFSYSIPILFLEVFAGEHTWEGDKLHGPWV